MLFLRALIPAGVMLAPDDGHLALVLCGVEISAPAQHHAGHDHTAHHHGLHADPACPYAQSAGPAPLPALPALAGAPTPGVLVLPTALAQTFLAFGPTRQQTPRGPPHLA